MANNPVQSVIDSDRFVRNREITGGGSNKDFFAGHDAAFRTHREQLRKQVSAIRTSLATDAFGGIAYAKVELQRAALAKSHRPLRSIFQNARTPIVGSAGVGNLIVEVSPEALAVVEQTVEKAEDSPRLSENRKTGKLEPRPSIPRSEVGAIRKVDLWNASDRRTFSAKDAVSWLSDSQTGGGYLVEFFRLPESHSQLEAMSARHRKLYRSLEDGLKQMGSGIHVQPLEDVESQQAVLFVRLEKSDNPAYVQIMPGRIRRLHEKTPPVDVRIERHERLLQFLDSHPLVRSILLAPKVVRTRAEHSAPSGAMSLPPRGSGPYALVGVVDGGVNEVLAPWVIQRIGLLAEEDRDEAHGTFIGGLLVGGDTTNPDCGTEPPGCEIVDIDILPVEGGFGQYYPRGVIDFFDEVENAVIRCRTAFGVRTFNLSLNLNSPVSPDSYNYFASRLDSLADRHDVIIVISAGNLKPPQARNEWTNDPQQNLAILASSRNDGILSPAESVRNISVAALNPSGHAGCIPNAPAAYSRRGPGLRTGLKPDLTHVGGALIGDPVVGHGLYSLLPTGESESGCGTSYSAPLVARTLAQLDLMIEGSVNRETLIALLIHGARIPEPVSDKALEVVARDLVGFGKPRCATDILQADDHEITLVFESRLVADTEMVFPFAWPQSLVTDDGSCRGRVQMTLVATPPLDFRHNAEIVRVNLDAVLQQEKGDKYVSKLTPTFVPEGVSDVFERDLIEHALKWSPVKSYRGNFPRGVGESSNWRVRVSYLLRALETMPPDGVPFSLVLTISDPDKTGNVFGELRQSLQSMGIVTTDIRSAARLRPRA